MNVARTIYTLEVADGVTEAPPALFARMFAGEDVPGAELYARDVGNRGDGRLNFRKAATLAVVAEYRRLAPEMGKMLAAESVGRKFNLNRRTVQRYAREAGWDAPEAPSTPVMETTIMAEPEKCQTAPEPETSVPVLDIEQEIAPATEDDFAPALEDVETVPESPKPWRVVAIGKVPKEYRDSFGTGAVRRDVIQRLVDAGQTVPGIEVG